MEEELKPSQVKVWSYFQQAVSIWAPTSDAVRNRCFFPCFSYEMGYSVLVGGLFFTLQRLLRSTGKNSSLPQI